VGAEKCFEDSISAITTHGTIILNDYIQSSENAIV
jgi:hypothetical protein